MQLATGRPDVMSEWGSANLCTSQITGVESLHGRCTPEELGVVRNVVDADELELAELPSNMSCAHLQCAARHAHLVGVESGLCCGVRNVRSRAPRSHHWTRRHDELDTSPTQLVDGQQRTSHRTSSRGCSRPHSTSRHSQHRQLEHPETPPLLLLLSRKRTRPSILPGAFHFKPWFPRPPRRGDERGGAAAADRAAAAHTGHPSDQDCGGRAWMRVQAGSPVAAIIIVIVLTRG